MSPGCAVLAREMDDEAIKEELTRFKGVGAKTVACVLMFCLERPEFPVDVHVRAAGSARELNAPHSAGSHGLPILPIWKCPSETVSGCLLAVPLL